jgi:hypothetical protein
VCSGHRHVFSRAGSAITESRRALRVVDERSASSPVAVFGGMVEVSNVAPQSASHSVKAVLVRQSTSFWKRSTSDVGNNPLFTARRGNQAARRAGLAAEQRTKPKRQP